MKSMLRVLTITSVIWICALCANATAQNSATTPHAHEEVTLKNGAVMIYDQNVAVPLTDGSFIYANVFRPKAPGKYPVILAQGPYGKDMRFRDAYASDWVRLTKANPDLCAQSSCKYVRWEFTDPERWIGNGYVVIMADVRGAGYTPGYLDMLSPREARDFYDLIEWSGKESWSNGKVGLLGISYLAINQWQVAALQPPHLAAIIPWEGATDFYRDVRCHGGIASNLYEKLWWQMQILPNQNGNGNTPSKDATTGQPTTGTPLNDHLLQGNRHDPMQTLREHPLLDAYNSEESPVLNRINVPLLSAGNLSGNSLHGRGNYEGFEKSSSKEKWLVMHAGTHIGEFYSDAGVALQHKFFDHYLKGVENGWEKTPAVTLVVRDPASSAWHTRTEQGWPIPRTQWTTYHLDAANEKLVSDAPAKEASTSFDAGKTASLFNLTFDKTTELTGPLSAHLWVSSTTTDADLFVTLQIFDAAGNEVTFAGANDPAAPFSQGWLRASHRKLDPALSKPYQPVHTHDEIQKLVPGQLYPVDVEIWPSSVVVHPGYRLALRVEGADFQRPVMASDESIDENHHGAPIGNRGSGIFLHNDPADRPAPEFTGTTTIATGSEHDSFVVLPVIPPK